MHWRETMRPTRFFVLDGRASAFLLLAAVSPSLEVIVGVIILIGVLMWAEREGLTVVAAMRLARQKVAGVLQLLNPKLWVGGLGSRVLKPRNHRPAVPWNRTRAIVDNWTNDRQRLVAHLRQPEPKPGKKPADGGAHPGSTAKTKRKGRPG